MIWLRGKRTYGDFMGKNLSENHIQKLPPEARPYEKCKKYGPAILTDAELLSIVLRNGTKGENVLQLSQRLCQLSDQWTGIGGLCHCRKEVLLSVRGIGEVKANQILCIAELSRRAVKAGMKDKLDFSSPHLIAEYYMEDMRHLDREILKILLLDAKNRLIADRIISTGTVTMAPASPREIFREALLAGAVNIILLHNHPSGDPTPSQEDILITKQIADAGELVGITLLDHIIIGDRIYRSIGIPVED